MRAVFGLMVGIGLTLVLAVFGLTLRALLDGALPLFLGNLFGGYVGGKFGELS